MAAYYILLISHIQDIEKHSDRIYINILIFIRKMKLSLLIPFTTPPVRNSDSIQNLQSGDERNYSEPDSQGSRIVANLQGLAMAWDGAERRQQDRRDTPRRQENQGVLLDTRTGHDRRRTGRRASDQRPPGGFSFKA